MSGQPTIKSAGDKTKKARLLLVDDHPLVREQLSQLIAQQPDLTVCGACEDAGECLGLLPKAKPDLVVVDLSLRNTHGIELIKDIKIHHPGLRVLVLSMHDEALFAERALRAGALGYVTKQESTDTIMTAIRRVLAGEMFLTERMATQLVGRLIHASTGAAGSGLPGLSDRELEIFQMLGEGQGTRQIAEALHLDVKTVETYRLRLKEKLHVNTASELLQRAVQWTQSNRHAE
jgi:DNA-binding NarL/FixJ family response regulator